MLYKRSVSVVRTVARIGWSQTMATAFSWPGDWGVIGQALDCSTIKHRDSIYHTEGMMLTMNLRDANLILAR